jgi:predicted lipoprotein with Yx(FWY)xxD motif
LAVALAATACGSSSSASSGGSSSPPTAAASSTTAPSTTGSSGNALKTAKIGGATVLTNAKGFTVYSFGTDGPNRK